MTHYKMNRLHLGGGESLSTSYRRTEPALKAVKSKASKTATTKKAKATRQCRGS